MDERSRQSIMKHLQDATVQERIRQNMQRGRTEAVVKISSAARLFNFTENQLRDWERRGLLKPPRSKDTSGQRQYSPAELDKLAIIRELMNQGYSPSEIPPYDDELWNVVTIPDGQQAQAPRVNGEDVQYLPINWRIEDARAGLFWRYFASHVLRLSLMLICEDIPDTTAGLILPLRRDIDLNSIHRIEDLPEVGESLVGWLSRSRSSYTFLTLAPSFEYSSDYRLLRLQVMTEDEPGEASLKDSTLIILDRRSKPLTLSKPSVETIRRLLIPIYEEGQNLAAYFGPGMRDMLDPATDFDSSVNYADIILTRLAEMIVRLGGRTSEEKQRWRFCCILLPKDSRLSLEQRSLVVRAKSKDAPVQYRVGVTMLSPGEPIIGLSLRAFQSGHIVYRSQISSEDFTIAFRDIESSICSAIAVPVGGEDGQPIGVVYVGSDELDAFTEGEQHKGDQRVLRMMSRIVEELLRTYEARLRIGEKLAKMMSEPGIIDTSFKDFSSESEFVHDVENLLMDIRTRMDQLPENAVSFIAIDIDNESRFANKYGNRTTRNLSKEVGLRIQGQLKSIVTKDAFCKLYHIYADKFYLLLRGIPLERARKFAEQLRNALEGSYQVDVLRSLDEQPSPSDSRLIIHDVTARLGVTSYEYAKLREMLITYNPSTMVSEVRSKITIALDQALEIGRNAEGNVVISWDREMQGFVRIPANRIK